MKKTHKAIILALTTAFLFYPGENFFYTYEQMNESAFELSPSLSTLEYPIPAVKADASDPIVSAEGVYIVERKTFTVVYKKNADKKLYPASTTKILTALTTIENKNLDEIVVVKNATDEGQIMGLIPNEKMSVENLLYGILVHSANDAAYALANADEDFSGFMSLVNAKAKEIGMKNSFFTNPAGLDEPNQLTTPHDLALAAKALLEIPTLRRMVSIKGITVLDEDFRTTHELSNVNELLGDIEGLGGIKTGYTEASGENLVSYFKTPYSNHEYIIVVMNSKNRFEDTRAITQWLTFNIDYLSL